MLIGKSTLQVFSTYGEKGNLFTVVIAPLGSGKTPTCHLICIDPIVEHLEPKIEKSIVMDDTSSNGLFNHFVSGDTVPVLCIDEAHSFLMKISLSKSPQANLTGTLVQMFQRRLLVRAEGEQRQTHRDTLGKRFTSSIHYSQTVPSNRLAKDAVCRKWFYRTSSSFLPEKRRERLGGYGST